MGASVTYYCLVPRVVYEWKTVQAITRTDAHEQQPTAIAVVDEMEYLERGNTVERIYADLI